MSANKSKLQALLDMIGLAAQTAISEYEKAGGDVPTINSTGPHPLDNAIDQVALKSAIRTLEGACDQLCTILAPPSYTAINLVKVYDYACIRVALKENITDILMDYPKGIHVDDLSKIVGIDAKKLARLLRLLTTRGCYVEVEGDTFANNRLSLTLHSENPVRHVLNLHSEVTEKGGTVLYETLKDARTAYSNDPEHAPIMYANNKEGITGNFFDWMRQEDAWRESYQYAMTGLNGSMGTGAFLTRFPFGVYSTVVDVGGGIGGFSIPLAKAHKHVKITLHDLPEVLVQTRRVWERDCSDAILENRIEFAELNFFSQIPVREQDIYYLRNIIHDWPDDRAVLILRNIRLAMGLHSRVLIHDRVLGELGCKQTEDKTASLSTNAFEPLLPHTPMYQQDLAMLILHNAKERTMQNFLELTTAAGLRLEKVWDLVETCVLEFSGV